MITIHEDVDDKTQKFSPRDAILYLMREYMHPDELATIIELMEEFLTAEELGQIKLTLNGLQNKKRQRKAKQVA